MYSPIITRALPEKVYVSVLNNSSNVMSTGHAVLWDYRTNTASTSSFVTGNGYAVTFARTFSTTAHHPAHFAGIVAVRDIQGGDYGVLQVYGETSSVIVSGISTAPWFGTHAQTEWNDTSLWTIILRPFGVCSVTAGAATNAGHMGILSLVTTIAGTQTYASADINMDLRPFWHGGYVVPLGPLYNATGTTSVTATYASSAFVKGFIHCMQ